MNWITRIIRPTPLATRTTTLHDPLVIYAPKLRFLNLLGPAAASHVADDRAALTQLFPDAEEVTAVEACDVLVLYVQVEEEGRDLKRIIEASQAPIVVVASENSGDAYIKASASEPQKHTNLVLTIARNGASFEHFFRALFAKMFRGVTMPVAWVELVPQAPGASHANAPETIFACGAGHVRFQA